MEETDYFGRVVPQGRNLGMILSRMPHHIPLQGNAPRGRNWTAVASPYWPAFASTWASACAPYWQDAGTFTPCVSHLSGFGVATDSLSVQHILDMTQYRPSGKRSTFVAALHFLRRWATSRACSSGAHSRGPWSRHAPAGCTGYKTPNGKTIVIALAV